MVNRFAHQRRARARHVGRLRRCTGSSTPPIWGAHHRAPALRPVRRAGVRAPPAGRDGVAPVRRPSRTSDRSAIYIGLVVAQGNVVDPIFLGKQLRLSSIVIFLGSLFWFWIWGPVGLFLAVPLLRAIRDRLQAHPAAASGLRFPRGVKAEGPRPSASRGDRLRRERRALQPLEELAGVLVDGDAASASRSRGESRRRGPPPSGCPPAPPLPRRKGCRPPPPHPRVRARACRGRREDVRLRLRLLRVLGCGGRVDQARAAHHAQVVAELGALAGRGEPDQRAGLLQAREEVARCRERLRPGKVLPLVQARCGTRPDRSPNRSSSSSSRKTGRSWSPPFPICARISS